MKLTSNLFRIVLILCMGVVLEDCSRGDVPPPRPSPPFVEPVALEDGAFPGGTTTVRDHDPQAFSHPMLGSTTQESRDFFTGNAFFRDPWVTAPSSTKGRDGLGPVFNAISCGSCHNQDGRGIGYRDGKIDVSLLFRLSRKMKDGTYVDDPFYGGQIEPKGVVGTPGEGQPKVRFKIIHKRYPDGDWYELQQPIFDFSELRYGPLDVDDVVSPRVAPQMIGLGLIEAIGESDILANEDPEDKNGDGIRGHANHILDVVTGQMVLGRFGWKANQPNLRQQSAGAFLGDMGLTTSIFPNTSCTAVELECMQAPSGGEPEVSDKILDRVVTYAHLLAPSTRRNPSNREIARGQGLFKQINCVGCHTPHFTTTATHDMSVLNNQSIWPYSDFLVHDMGEALADNRPDGEATVNEWRTPPLWGIGLFPIVSDHMNLLHDARARGVEEAILWHGGEATNSKNAFMHLSRKDRQAVIHFVEDL